MSLEILRDPQNIFFRCVEDCSESIMITNKDNQLVYVNPAWQRIYGYSYEEATKDTPRILRAESQDPEFYKVMWADILDPEKGYWRGEIINKTKNGEKVPVLLTITPFKGSEGNVTGYMGIAVDIREKKKLEEQIMHQDRLASVGMLASGLAHEIGTPLGTIRGRAELLQMAPQLTDMMKSGLSVIISQIDRVSKLIDSLLRISRSKQSVELMPMRLSPIFHELGELLFQKAKYSNVEIQLDCPEDLKVNGERARFTQVLLNLSINAIHAIQERQKLQPSLEGKIILSAKKHGDTVVVKVQDNGCGIPDENLTNLFKPFFTTKDIGMGTGLGLAIVNRIVDELNGKIFVESTLNVGTEFIIEFV
ncbi:MAG: ATP-binding protein [Bdellovibrionota bacterium]|nr:ATP-binding protein [Bdellovibrionota bacterium]